jgi:hypothetical protein
VPPPPPRLDTAGLTWSVLLGHWTAFARASLALPDDAPGSAMRQTVPDAIGLQALWFALQQLPDLPPDQQALGHDRAAVLLDKHRQHIQSTWAAAQQPIPPLLNELLDDVQTALATTDTPTP